MKAFGFLSFGHYDPRPGSGHTQIDMLHQAVDLSVGADELGVNGAYFRVHHFAPQAAAPIPLLATIAARTQRIEVGTGVIDMRYEHPLHLAEEAAALDILADNRIALGVSRGSPEYANRGYEAFGHTGSTDPRGADLGRQHFLEFLEAINGADVVDADPKQFGPGKRLAIEPQSDGLQQRIWWGAGTVETARWAAEQGVNLMSSTLLTEATGESLGALQARQFNEYKKVWREQTHGFTPRVSVSRSVFPIVDGRDQMYFGASGGAAGQDAKDQIGVIDGMRSTFGKTYADEPDKLVEQLLVDEAVMAADTLMLTIPSQLGVDYNLHVLESFAKYVAPELGWQPNTEGPVTGYPID